MYHRSVLLAFTIAVTVFCDAPLSKSTLAQTSSAVRSPTTRRFRRARVSLAPDLQSRTGRCDVWGESKSTDISGIYSVTVTSAKWALQGKATLTIADNNFIFTGDS